MNQDKKRARGEELTQRVMRRYRNQSDATDAMARVLMLVVGGSCAMAIALYLWQIRAMWANPYKIVAGVGFGLAFVSFRWLANARLAEERLWRRQGRGPIRRRLLRWLGVRAAQTCAYCRDDLDSDEPTECPTCGAGYHPECAEELGRCATLHCLGLGEPAPRRAKVRLKDPVV
ncbi:MAG TPA: hypothetical protein DEA08_24050 [Planctomycetes bacterium]|nr:hypothetical protein [Planctomycetota bacterium]